MARSYSLALKQFRCRSLKSTHFVGNVESRRTDNGIHLSLLTIRTHNTILCNLVDGGKMHIDILILNRLHIRISRRDSPAAHFKLGSEALQQPLILDEIRHPLAEHSLGYLLSLASRVEKTAESVDLVLNVLCVRDQFLGCMAELVFVRGAVLVVLAEVVGDLYEPDAGADEDIHVLDVRLHLGYCLDGGGTRADDGDAIILPLFFLVVLVPFCRVDDAALEFIKTLDLGPLEVV